MPAPHSAYLMHASSLLSSTTVSLTPELLFNYCPPLPAVGIILASKAGTAAPMS